MKNSKDLNLSTNEQRGFTLIELVIVIVLIGILAATALPKFANLTQQARNAANDGIGGAIAAAVSITHASWISNGASSATSNTVNLEGGFNITVNSYGWPVPATYDGPGCSDLFAGLLSSNSPNLTPASTLSGISDACNPVNGPADNCYASTGSSPTCTWTLTINSPLNSIQYNSSNGSVSITNPSS